MITHECLHNLTYWNYNSNLGIGPEAHSRIIESSSSVAAIPMWHKPKKCLDLVKTKNVGIQTNHKLTYHDIIEEMLMMGLRLSKGINISTLKQKLNTKLENISDMNNLKHYKALDLITLNKIIYLSDKGLMLLHST